MCPMDSTMGIGNAQNGTNGLILWYSFLVGSVRNGSEKNQTLNFLTLAAKLSRGNVIKNTVH